VQKGAAHAFRITDDVAWDYIDMAQARVTTQLSAPPALVYFGTLAQRHAVSKRTIRAILGETSALRYLDLNLRDGPDNRRLAEESLELVQLLAWQDGVAIRSEPWGSPAFNRGVAHLVDRFQLQRLIVTRGPHGYASFDASGQCESDGAGLVVPALVDTVGAGDGFSAMLMACQLAGRTLHSSLGLANEYAASVCSHRGPMDHDLQVYTAWRERLAASTAGNAV
jgi:fructokinase